MVVRSRTTDGNLKPCLVRTQHGGYASLGSRLKLAPTHVLFGHRYVGAFATRPHQNTTTYNVTMLGEPSVGWKITFPATKSTGACTANYAFIKNGTRLVAVVAAWHVESGRDWGFAAWREGCGDQHVWWTAGYHGSRLV